MDGDFGMTVEVTITAQNKANNACGIGLGMTTGFTATDTYAYMLMRNSNNSTSGAYVNVAFTGEGRIGDGLWTTDTAPLSLGDGSYVGWKSAGCSGLNLASLTTAEGTSATIAEQATEYDTRDHILNRVVTVTAGAPSGYEAVPAPWDVAALAAAWGAP